MLEEGPFYNELLVYRFCSTLELLEVSRNIVGSKHGMFGLILLQLYLQREELHQLVSKQQRLTSKIQDDLVSQLN